MRKLVVQEFVTLDGVMQAPGGPDEDRRGGFEHGGWISQNSDQIEGKFIRDSIATSGCLLLGRTTYEIFAAYWPFQPAENTFAAMMNSLPKYVASTTLKEPLKWSNSTLIKGDTAEEVWKLKQMNGKNLNVIGSGVLVQSLMQNNLVDEYRLMVHPIVLGSGMRLFRENSPKTTLKLIDSKTTTTGVVILTYQPEKKTPEQGKKES